MDCPLTGTACSLAPGNKWLRWLIFLPSTIWNCLLFMFAGWKKKHNLQSDKIEQRVLPFEVLSTLPGRSWPAGWLSDEGAELNRREGQEKGHQSCRVRQSICKHQHPQQLEPPPTPPPTKKKKEKKKKSGGRCVGPAARATFHTVLRFQRAACAESRTCPPPANLLCSFSRQKINEAFSSLRWVGSRRVAGEGGVRCFPLGENTACRKGVKQAVYDTPGFSQVFREELNEAEGETFVPPPRRLSSPHCSTCGCEAIFFLPPVPPFLPASRASPDAKWPLCLLLLSISFHLWALQFPPVPLSRIRKAADASAELSVEDLQTLSHTHLIVHTNSCISLSGFLIRLPWFVYSGWCK